MSGSSLVLYLNDLRATPYPIHHTAQPTTLSEAAAASSVRANRRVFEYPVSRAHWWSDGRLEEGGGQLGGGTSQESVVVCYLQHVYVGQEPAEPAESTEPAAPAERAAQWRDRGAQRVGGAGGGVLSKGPMGACFLEEGRCGAGGQFGGSRSPPLYSINEFFYRYLIN
jgi:hypothetical protein